MSTGVELVPLVLALGAVVAATRKRQVAEYRSVLTVVTRLRDAELLVAALDAQGRYYGDSDGVLYGSLEGTSAAFTRAGDVFEVHFDTTVDEGRARTLVANLDEEYARLVQQRTYERVVGGATDHGLELESERVEEGEIVLTLRVQ